MLTIAAFLKPTKIKLIFLVEWACFILITAARGNLATNFVPVAAYPLVFFYLIACTITALSKHTQRVAQSWRLPAIAVGLILVDQAIKTGVTASIPYQTSLPIIKNWLHLAHECNFHGAWIASYFDIQSVDVFNLIQWGLIVPSLLLSILFRRYYITTHRQSLWVDVAFLGIFSGCASWIGDMALRGHIVDYISLPGLVTADLKDIFVLIGVAALVAEALDSPRLSWRWRGIRQEIDVSIQLIKNLWSFFLQELDEARRVVMRKLKRTAHPD